MLRTYRYKYASQHIISTSIIHIISNADRILSYFQNDRPYNVMVIDYQTLRCSSLVNDLLSFVGSCFEVELRRKHFHKLVQDYYSSLEDTLKAAGICVPQVCTKEMLQLEIRDQSFLCLAIGIFFIAFFDTDPLDIEVLYSGDLPSSFSQASPRFVQLANDLIEDYVSWGFEL